MRRIAEPDGFRARLGTVIERTGLSFAAFARKAGIDRSTLSQLLDADADRLPRAETLAAIASSCNVSVDWLLGLSQREEIGAAIIEAVLQIETTEASQLDDRFMDWLQEAAGFRIKTVPATLPDFLKTEAVLRFEYAPSLSVDVDKSLELARNRLDFCRRPDTELEAAVPVQAFESLAAGAGLWSGLSAADRREQLRYAAELYDSLYPGIRLYLFDQRATFSVPFTVFGRGRTVVYLGHSYLVLSAIEHIGIFARRFDELIRASTVQPHAVRDFLVGLAGTVRC
jgi:transcriptional regulator with XRE-family HTH domain